MIEQLYEQAGCGSATTSLGCYQYIALILIIGTINTGGYFFYGLAYYELIPKFKCMYEVDVPQDFWTPNCEASLTCNLEENKIAKFKVDSSKDFSYDNLVIPYSLQCKSKNQIGLIGSMCFLGWATGCLILPKFADKNGRKQIFLASVFIQFFLWVGIIYGSNLYILYILCVAFGVCIAGRYTVGYCLLVESIPKAYQI